MTPEEAIKYLTPIVESASLPGYKAALGLALDALRRESARADVTRFDRIRACQTPEEMAVELNANGRWFCPKEYSRKETTCAIPCGECIVAWLREEGQT